MIPKETIDQIYTTARIEEVIGDYMTLRRRGANLWGNCPFHDEKTPSFSVSPVKGIYKCFGCGKAGNAVNFVMEYEKCSYVEALKQIAKKYHIEVKEKELTEEEKRQEDERESMFKTNEWANKWFQQQLWETEEGQNIGLSYFISRGLREDIIRKFQLGYSPERNALYRAAQQAGWANEYLEKTGLCGISLHDGRRYDRFRDRVIFPIFTISGKVVAFAGRILKDKKGTGKYINSPDSAIYNKYNELYGLFQAKQEIDKQNMCYLVEGQMDVISMHIAGIQNVVSSGGTSLTHHQILLLHRLTENVTLLYDGDAAGIHAALRGIDMLLEEGMNLKVVLLPDGEDPDSLSRKMNAVDFQQFLQDNSQDFIRFKTALLLKDAQNDPIKRSSVIKDIVQSISVIPDRITRQVYIKDCSNMLGIREDELNRETLRLRQEKYDKKGAGKRDAREVQDEPEPQEEQTSTPAAPPSTPQPVLPTLSDRLDQNICNLLQVIVRYGEYPLFDTTVGNYVLEELQNDQIHFENPLYEEVLGEFRAHKDDEGFQAETFFKYHPDSRISSFAIGLISEPYELSRIYSHKNISENIKAETKMPTDADRLTDLVPQLMLELKLTIIKEQQLYIREALKHAQENNQADEIMELMRQEMQYKDVERQLCKLLGSRIRG